MVTVFVGSDATPFLLYKEVICQDSLFFKAAFQSTFKEGEEQTLFLPDDDVRLFGVYQTWLNTNQLRYSFEHEQCWLHLAKLWIFADKICALKFRNKVVDAFFDVYISNAGKVKFASAHTVNYVYEHTAVNSSLRELFLGLFFQMDHDKPNMVPYPCFFLASIAEICLLTEGCLSAMREEHDYMSYAGGSHKFHEFCDGPSCRRRVSRRQ